MVGILSFIYTESCVLPDEPEQLNYLHSLSFIRLQQQ